MRSAPHLGSVRSRRRRRDGGRAHGHVRSDASGRRAACRPPPARRPGVILAVATVGFVVNFWAWALLSPLGPDLKQSLGLSSFQQALVVAVPVIVGALGRIPVGALTDRYGGRVMFPAISFAAVVPMLFLGLVGTRSLAGLLVGGFFLGIAGTVFAVGIPLVSAWYPPQRRGLRARRVRRRHGWHRDQRADHRAAGRRGQHPDAVHADRRRPGRLRVRRLGGAPGRPRPHPADRAARPPARLDRAAADHPAGRRPCTPSRSAATSRSRSTCRRT